MKPTGGWTGPGGDMAQGPLRNPLAGFALALVITAVIAGVAGFASTFLPYLEFRLFFLGFVLFAAGFLAARKVFLGSLGFVGAYLGGFAGFYVAELLFWADVPMELLALALALAAGLGGFVAGKIGVLQLSRMKAFVPTLRRCHNCGARVGWNAHKCWSCKASLSS